MIKIKLKDYLQEHDISLYWLSETTDIRYATLHTMYNQSIQKINLNYLDAIMTALNISDMNLLLEKNEEDV